MGLLLLLLLLLLYPGVLGKLTADTPSTSATFRRKTALSICLSWSLLAAFGSDLLLS
jgi:hypothetical protein